MPVFARAIAALLVSVVLLAAGAVAVLVGAGKRLEDACLRELTESGWDRTEGVVVRGPIPEGPITFRCESLMDPESWYVFTDPVPLVGAVVVGLGTLGLVGLTWWAALPRGRPRAAR